METNIWRAEDEARIIRTYREVVASGRPCRLEVCVNQRGRLSAVDVITRESRIFTERRDTRPFSTVDRCDTTL